MLWRIHSMEKVKYKFILSEKNWTDATFLLLVESNGKSKLNC